MNATITSNQLVLSSDTATVATAETFALTFVPDWVYPEIYVRAEQDDTRVEVLVSEGSAVVPLGVGTWDISVVGRKNGTDLVTNKVKLYVDRPDIHHIVSEEPDNMITELDDGLYLGYPNQIKHSTEANAKAEATATGLVITRNVADANPAETVNLQNASSTGNVAEYKFNGNLVGFVDKNGTFGGGIEQTTTNKNKYLPLLKDSARNIIAKKFTFYWNGSSYAADNSNGFGYQALNNNTGASSNGFGHAALNNNTGDYSNGFGHLALSNNTGAYNNGFGYLALSNNTGASSNGFGHATLNNNTGASSNGFGHAALNNNTGASSNGFGYHTLINNTGAYSNGFGCYALRYNQKSNNTAIGHNSYGSSFLENSSGDKTCAYTDIDITLKRATITAHGFGATNECVNIKYQATSDTAIGGLTVGTIYQIKIIDDNTIEFYTGGTKINLTSQGAGTHTFRPQYAYTNVTCLGANTTPNKDNQVVLGNSSVDTIKMGGTARTPESATAPGVKGETCWDSNYFYICVSDNSWIRFAKATWE